MAATTEARLVISARDKASAQLTRIRKSLMGIKASAGAVTSALTGMGGIASVGGLAMLTRRAVDAGSAITDMATQVKTGIEQIQVLNYAAQEAGASQESMVRALRNMEQRLGQAATGMKSYSEAIERLGLDVEELIALPQEKRLEAISRAYANAADKTRAYSDVSRILGQRAAPELMEVMKRLADEGFGALAIAAREKGQVMNEETAKALDQNADMFAEWQTRVTNIVGQTFADFQTENGKGIISLQLIKGAIGFSKAIMTGVVEVLKVLRAGIAGVANVLVEGFKSAAEITQSAFGVAANKFKLGLMEVVNAMASVLNSGLEKIEGAVNNIPGVSVSLGKIGGIDTGETRRALEEDRKKLRDIEFDPMQSFKKGYGRSYENNDLAVSGRFDEAIKEIDFTIESLREMGSVTSDTKEKQKSLYDTLKESAESAKKAIQETTKTASTMHRDIANGVGAVASSIENGLINAAKNGKAAFGDMAQFIIAEIQRILIRSMVLRPLFGFIGGLFPASNVIGQAFSGAFSTRGAFGGGFQGGQSVLVGEHGPELLRMPSGGGRITPNREINTSGPTFNVDMRGADVAAVSRLERLVAQVNGTLEQRAVAAVGQTYSRNPQYLR